MKGAPSNVCTVAVNSRSAMELGSIRNVTRSAWAGRQFFTRYGGSSIVLETLSLLNATTVCATGLPSLPMNARTGTCDPG